MVLKSYTNPFSPQTGSNFAPPRTKMATILVPSSRPFFSNLSVPRKRAQASTRPNHYSSSAMEPRTQKPPPKNPRPTNPPDGDFKLSLLSTLQSFINSGRFGDALYLFDEMPHSEPYMWNMMFRGFARKGMFNEAVEFHLRMEAEGVRGDQYTYPFVVKACAVLGLMVEGRRVHGKLFKLGLLWNEYVCNSLISMYAKFGCMECAEMVFDGMPARDSVSWNSMISGYLFVGDFWTSLSCLQEMVASGVRPNRFSMISSLGICSLTCYVRHGKEVHCQVIRSGFESDIKVQASLVDMYGKCKRLDCAERLFNTIRRKNDVVWNAMIGGYALNLRTLESFACLRKMQEGGKFVKPDVITAVNILPSCGSVGALLEGKSIHGYAIRNGFFPRKGLETALVDMYGRCEGLKYAERLFSQKTEKDVASWNAMITAYVQNGWNAEGLELFRNLLNKALQPDVLTIRSIIPAYIELASLREAREMHSFIMKLNDEPRIFISNSIIYLYAKCGDLEAARKHFDGMVNKNNNSWNAIIMAYAIHGLGRNSLQLFSDMSESPVKPNAKTFYALLLSCRTSGMVSEGLDYFNAMINYYDIDPGVEHLSCMVGLLGQKEKF